MIHIEVALSSVRRFFSPTSNSKLPRVCILPTDRSIDARRPRSLPRTRTPAQKARVRRIRRPGISYHRFAFPFRYVSVRHE